MQSLTCALVFTIACVIHGCYGLDLTLDRDVRAVSGDRGTCGVLLCEEKFHNDSSTAVSEPGDATPPAIRTVSSMRLLKTPSRSRSPSSTAGGLEDGTRQLLATLTPQRPKVTRAADAIKVDGSLEGGLASLRVRLVKGSDCRAAFTCVVSGVDTQGRQVVRTSHLLQQQHQHDQSPDGGQDGVASSWGTPALAWRLLDLVQRLHGDMTLTRSSVGNMEVKMAELEGKVEVKMAELEGKVESLQADLGGKINSVEKDLADKIFSTQKEVGSKVRSMEAVFRDEMKAFENRIEDRVNSLENRLEDRIESELASLKTDLTCEKIDVAAFGPLLRNSVDESLTALKEEFKGGNWSLNRHQLDELQKATLNTSESLARHLNGKISSLREGLETDLQHLSSSINATSEAIQSTVSSAVYGLDTLTVSDVELAITNLLMPKACERGVVSVLSHPPYPYPVIFPGDGSRLDVPYLCDTLTDGGGWVLIQRRATGKVDFYRPWAAYKDGFGLLDDDFWLGNEKIHQMTSQGVYELRIELRYKAKSAFAHYATFSVSDEQSGYVLSLGSYDGTAGDSLAYHSGRSFSTYDRDNDDNSSSNCADAYTGAWWYGNCHHANLNGVWGASANKGPRWHKFSDSHAVAFSEMKIRRVK